MYLKAYQETNKGLTWHARQSFGLCQRISSFNTTPRRAICIDGCILSKKERKLHNGMKTQLVHKLLSINQIILKELFSYYCMVYSETFAMRILFQL